MLSPLKRIRLWLAVMIFGLVVSGLTALPLQTELNILARFASAHPDSGLSHWIFLVRDGLVETNSKFPFIAYGTDWLAFAHIVIAIAFIGPLRDPVKNIWVIEFGMIACALIIPFAIIAGGYRGIPLSWRLIDCAFGVCGIIPLIICRAQIRQLARSPSKS